MSVVRAIRAIPPVVQPVEVFLCVFGFLAGTADELPGFFYIANAIGPFDWLVLALLMRWVLFTPRTLTGQSIRVLAPFFVFAAFAYVGELRGALIFDGTTVQSIIDPVRYLYYPTLFFTLTPLLRTERHLRVLFSAYVFGVLMLAVIEVFRSPDPSFFFGLPVLYNPNVIGNFIGYAFICLGFAFMPRSVAYRLTIACALFVFALFTFSKASWLLALLGIYINATSISRWKLLAVVVLAAAVSFAFVDWGHVIKLVTDAIDLKLESSVGNDQSGGTFYMRLGFFMSTVYALFDYPIGMGLRNFPLVNDTYARALGPLYFPTNSPHTAVGFVCAEAGWVGLGILVIVLYRVATALRGMFAARDALTSSVVVAMLLISILFQIEFFTQPFMYLVLAAGVARSVYWGAGVRSVATGDRRTRGVCES